MRTRYIFAYNKNFLRNFLSYVEYLAYTRLNRYYKQFVIREIEIKGYKIVIDLGIGVNRQIDNILGEIGINRGYDLNAWPIVLIMEGEVKNNDYRAEYIEELDITVLTARGVTSINHLNNVIFITLRPRNDKYFYTDVYIVPGSRTKSYTLSVIRHYCVENLLGRSGEVSLHIDTIPHYLNSRSYLYGIPIRLVPKLIEVDHDKYKKTVLNIWFERKRIIGTTHAFQLLTTKPRTTTRLFKMAQNTQFIKELLIKTRNSELVNEEQVQSDFGAEPVYD